MATNENLAALERARGRWNAGDLDGYLQLYDASVVLHGYVGVEPGLASVRGFYQRFQLSFPGSQLTFEDVFGTADKVACRFTLRAKHGGPFSGVPATGKDVVLPGITILRFADGKCVERWTQADFLGLMVQLGALPSV